jgi:hypothetical protein
MFRLENNNRSTAEWSLTIFQYSEYLGNWICPQVRERTQLHLCERSNHNRWVQ